LNVFVSRASISSASIHSPLDEINVVGLSHETAGAAIIGGSRKNSCPPAPESWLADVNYAPAES